jgi:hypothetical protein
MAQTKERNVTGRANQQGGQNQPNRPQNQPGGRNQPGAQNQQAGQNQTGSRNQAGQTGGNTGQQRAGQGEDQRTNPAKDGSCGCTDAEQKGGAKKQTS